MNMTKESELENLTAKEKYLSDQLSHFLESGKKISSQLISCKPEEVGDLVTARIHLSQGEEQTRKTLEAVKIDIQNVHKEAEKQAREKETQRKQQLIEQLKKNLPPCLECGQTDRVKFVNVPPSAHGDWTAPGVRWAVSFSCERCGLRFRYFPDEPAEQPQDMRESLTHGLPIGPV